MSTSAWIYSQLFKNYSKITKKLLKKLLDIWNNEIAAASHDHAALRVSVMQWKLDSILHTVQNKECFYPSADARFARK